MAQDMFLKLDNIEGEAQDAEHKGEIEVLSWNWEMFQESNVERGTGLGSGKATFNPFYFTHYLDKASKNLIQHSNQGLHIPKGIFTARKASGEKQLEYWKIEFEDIIITNVSLSGSDADSARPVEAVHFSYNKFKVFYTGQDEKGNKLPTLEWGYDIKKNQQI